MVRLWTTLLAGADAKEWTWDDLPWATHRVMLVYAQRRV
jgi:hypothetical protein